MYQNCTIFILLFLSGYVTAQSRMVYGKVTNTKLEPLAFAGIEVKQIKTGTITKEDGSYELQLDEESYDLIVSMIGHQTQVVPLLLKNQRKDHRLVDYKFEPRGDPILFSNPNEAFQALDSTFPLFNPFYEAHFVHNF